MSFQPGDFIRVAERLCGLATTEPALAEASHRAAIGRAYYGAFLASRDYLNETSVSRTDTSRDTHGWVLEQLRHSADASARQLRATLWRLRDLRNAADYGDGLRDIPKQAAMSVQEADRALVQVAVLRSRAKPS